MHRNAKQGFQVVFQAAEGENRRARQSIHQEVNIAILAILSPKGGTEHAGIGRAPTFRRRPYRLPVDYERRMDYIGSSSQFGGSVYEHLNWKI